MTQTSLWGIIVSCIMSFDGCLLTQNCFCRAYFVYSSVTFSINDGNILTGTIPNVFGMLKMLEELDLSGNKLHGSMPLSLFTVPTLRRVNLRSNFLTGSIANAYSKASNLQGRCVRVNEKGLQRHNGMHNKILPLHCHIHPIFPRCRSCRVEFGFQYAQWHYPTYCS